MPVLRSSASSDATEIKGDTFVVSRGLHADYCVNDPACDLNRHFEIRREPTGYMLVPDKFVAVNGARVTQTVRIYPGDRISIGRTLLYFEDSIAPDDRTRCVRTKDDVQLFEMDLVFDEGVPVVLGRESTRQVRRLDHPLVSRQHAEILRNRSTARIRDLQSSNGTFVNGYRIHKSVELSPGDAVGIGPFQFQWLGDRLRPVNQSQGGRYSKSEPGVQRIGLNSDLACIGVTRTVSGIEKQLLADINIHFKTGEFVAIVGPSGAGKSTLLKTLGHREAANAKIVRGGKVLFGNVDLCQNFEQLKQRIAYVPQHEILFEDLTLEQSLRYTAAIRLPVDASAQDIANRVASVLQTVGLQDHGQTMIGKLSGGQRKRAALANELIADPGVLLLDEVTSGLDELTDNEMMSLFSEVAKQGKTVVCVTHTMSSIPETCDKLIALTQHGRLAFAGTPEQATEYFGVSRLQDIYPNLIASSPDCAEKISERFGASKIRPASLPELSMAPQNLLCDNASAGAIEKLSQQVSSALDLDLAFSWKQFVTLSMRYTHRTMSDARGIAMRIVQMLIVAVLLGIVFGRNLELAAQINCAFILCLSSYWFGCNNAAKEIVAERKIFEQERSVVLRQHSYAWSKLVLLAVIAAVQSILLTAIVVWYCKLGGHPVAWFLLSGSVSLAGTATGLAISASSRTEQIAVAAVPVVLIPQIILAGAVAQLSGVGLNVAKVAITSHWGFEAANSILTSSDGVPSRLWIAITVISLQIAIAFYFLLHGLQRKYL